MSSEEIETFLKNAEELLEQPDLPGEDKIGEAIRLLNTLVQPRKKGLASALRELERQRLDLNMRQVRRRITNEQAEVDRANLRDRVGQYVQLVRDLFRDEPPVEAPPSERESVAAGPKNGFNLEVLLGVGRLQQISWLQVGLAASNAVARVHFDRRNFGTAFHLGSGWLLTNNHVVPRLDATTCQRTFVEFGYQQDSTGYVPSVRYQLSESASEFWTDAALDASLIRLRNPDEIEKRWGKVIVNANADPEPGEFVAIVQHPNGSYKQIALIGNEVSSVAKPFVRYTTDTMPGSSGSPVFNDSWHVVAVHHAGGVRDTSSRKYVNEGVLISAIKKAAGDRWPAIG